MLFNLGLAVVMTFSLNHYIYVKQKTASGRFLLSKNSWHGIIMKNANLFYWIILNFYENLRVLSKAFLKLKE